MHMRVLLSLLLLNNLAIGYQVTLYVSDKANTEKNFTLDLDPSLTIRDLKDIVEDQTGICPSHLSVTYAVKGTTNRIGYGNKDTTTLQELNNPEEFYFRESKARGLSVYQKNYEAKSKKESAPSAASEKK